MENMNHLDKMTDEKPLKQFVKLAIPAIVIALFNEINGMIDAVFMGQYLGSQAIESMAIILPFLIFISALAFLFSEGAGIAIGRYLGAKDLSNANKTLGSTILITFIVGATIGFSLFFFVSPILNLFNLTPMAAYYASFYMKIVCIGLPLIMITIVLSKMVYTEGHAGFMLKITGLQALLNILVNYLLLGVLGYGVAGAAIATVLSLAVEGFFLYRFLQSDRMAMKLEMKHFRIHTGYFKEIVPLGIPTFVTMILLSFTLGIESKVISNFGGNALSVQTITGYIFSITSSIAYGIMGVAVVLLSYSVGAKIKQRFYEILKISLIAVFVISLAINLPLILKSDIIVRLFTDAPDIGELIKIPALIYGLTAPFIFTTNVLLYAMQPIGMEKTSTIVFALQQVILFIPLLMVLRTYGFVTAISAQPFSEVIGGILTVMLIPLLINRIKISFKEKTI